MSAAWRARLGSILAFVPLSLWVANHLFENLLVWTGEAQRWQAEVTDAGGPIHAVFVTVFVIGPLVIHTIWGLRRMMKSRPSYRPWTFENLRFTVQRLSAVGVLLFLAAHLYLARLEPALNAPSGHISLAEFSSHMRQPQTLLVYLAGTLGVTYHLANGLWGFLIHLGIYQGPKAQARLRNASIVVFLVLLSMAWASIIGIRNFTA